MLQNSFGVQLSYASVDRGDGTDPRAQAHEILSRLRVPAGIQDAASEWGERDEAVVEVPLTDDGHVLTLSDDDRIETNLTSGDLKAAFTEHGLTLWLNTDYDADNDLDAETTSIDDVPVEESGVCSDDDVTPMNSALFAASTVHVASFSHRGPGTARFLATMRRTEVTYSESEEWSLQQFNTSEPAGFGGNLKAELPVVELNRADSIVWFEVTASKDGAIPFWPEAERGTVPVLDLEAITVPETAEICRRLLAEGDGSHDELLQIARAVPLDVDAAHRALMAESLGGVVGAEARQRAFVAAFGVPTNLVEAAVDGVASGPQQRFLPVGWGTMLRESVIAGLGEGTPLTRRHRPINRLVEAFQNRPALAAGLLLAELIAGGFAVSRLRGTGRFIGFALLSDAVIDATILITRIRRSRQ